MAPTTAPRVDQSTVLTSDDNKLVKYLISRARKFQNDLFSIKNVFEEYGNTLKKSPLESRKAMTERFSSRFKNILSTSLIKKKDVDLETKTRVLIITKTPATDTFLNKIRRAFSTVTVNDQMIITGYEKSLSVQRRGRPLSAENLSLLKFWSEEAKKADKPFTRSAFFEKCKEKTNTELDEREIQNRFLDHLAPRVYKMDGFDVETKLRMMFVLQLPVESDFIYRARPFVTRMKINESNVIVSLTPLRPVENNVEPPNTAQTSTTQEKQLKLMDHIATEAKKALVPCFPREFFKEYKRISGCKESTDTLTSWFYNTLAPKLDTMDEYDDDEKARIFFVMNVPVHQEFLNKIKKTAEIVQIDRRQLICHYKKGDVELIRRINNEEEEAEDVNMEEELPLNHEEGPSTSGSTNEIQIRREEKEEEPMDVSSQPITHQDQANHQVEIDNNNRTDIKPAFKPPKIEVTTDRPVIPTFNPVNIKMEPIFENDGTIHIKTKYFLTMLKHFVSELNSVVMAGLQDRIQKTLDQTTSEDNLADEKVSATLELIFEILSNTACNSTYQGGLSTDWSFILELFKRYLLSFHLPRMKKLRQTVERAIDRPSNIADTKVLQVLDQLLTILTSK